MLNILQTEGALAQKRTAAAGTPVARRMTMVSLRKAQSTLLAKQLADAGNMAAAALVFGPFVSPRPFSLKGWLIGLIVWAILDVGALYVAGMEPQ